MSSTKTFEVKVAHTCTMLYRVRATTERAAEEAARKLALTDATRSNEENQYVWAVVDTREERATEDALTSIAAFDADAVLACTVAPDDEYDGYSAELHHHMDAVYGEGN